MCKKVIQNGFPQERQNLAKRACGNLCLKAKWILIVCRKERKLILIRLDNMLKVELLGCKKNIFFLPDRI